MLINKTRRSNKARFLLKYAEENSLFREVSYYWLIQFQSLSLKWVGWGWTLSLIGRGKRWGWALIRGWALNNYFCLKNWRFFEVGANSRLGAYRNKYGIWKSREICHLGLRLFTVPYFFVRSFRYTASYRHEYLHFQMYRAGGRRGS